MARYRIPLIDPEPAQPPPPWPVHTVLVLEDNALAFEVIRAEVRKRGSADVERATSADEALDMLGYVRQPFDLVFLSTGRLRADGGHVLATLRRQRPPSIVLGYHVRELPERFAWGAYIGIGGWLDLALTGRWTRTVSRAIEAGATLRSILESMRVPGHLPPALALRIYGAEPGEPFATGLDP